MTRTLLVEIVVMAIVTATSLCGAEPPTNQEWGGFQNAILAASDRGDFLAAQRLTTQLHSRCLVALGKEHPDTLSSAFHIHLYSRLNAAGETTRRQFLEMAPPLHKAWRGIRTLASDALPSPDVVCQMLATFHGCCDGISPDIPSECVFEAECRFGIARVIALSRLFDEAERLLACSRQGYLSDAGLAVNAKATELALAVVLRELHKEPEKQVMLLQGYKDFAERHETTPRIAWWKERAMTQLAETHFRLGNREEADRLYAEVRNRLPGKIDHSIAGWCKSWCDRHEARQLMEKGDWDAAYEKILQARVGTIDYGHRNLSKGLTMERILRMSAEIQRKRGNNKEADEDQEYADRIARHAAKLRVAVEAELKKLRESEANATPQPLPAP
jgi:hypothetical protein